MNILTFDIEDWFHILDNPLTKFPKNWSNFPSRIEYGLNQILEIVENNDISATFFVLGWIAEKYPNLVRKISEKGYEIGSHTHLHQLIYNQTPHTFKSDIYRSISTIENCIGKKVISFRAPGFSITKKNKWAFEVLSEAGIKIDCSVFPANRAHGGMPKYTHAKPSIIKYNNIEIKEFPINSVNFMGKPLIFSGGGYFRILPYCIIRELSKNSEYIMTYFHPRDFDHNQPIVPGLSLTRRFKSYVGLKYSFTKLNRWVKDFDFIDLRTADEKVDWSKVKKVLI